MNTTTLHREASEAAIEAMRIGIENRETTWNEWAKRLNTRASRLQNRRCLLSAIEILTVDEECDRALLGQLDPDVALHLIEQARRRIDQRKRVGYVDPWLRVDDRVRARIGRHQ